MKINNRSKELGQLYLYKVEGTGGEPKKHTFCYYVTPDISLWSEMQCHSENKNGDVTGVIDLLKFSLSLTVVSHNEKIKDYAPLAQAIKNMYDQLFNFLPADHWMHKRKDFYIKECLKAAAEIGIKYVIKRDDKPMELRRLKIEMV